MRRWLAHIRRTVSNSVNNDVLMLARAGAYSAIISIFPIVLVTAAIVASSPAAIVVRAELRSILYQMFPPDVPPLVLGYFQGQHRSLRLVLIAAMVFVLASNSVMTTLMEARRLGFPGDPQLHRIGNLPVGTVSPKSEPRTSDNAVMDLGPCQARPSDQDWGPGLASFFRGSDLDTVLCWAIRAPRL